MTFAYRCAPVQATWLGYFASTGLRTMDYVIADDQVIPPHSEEYFSEQIYRMPDSYMCFSPPDLDIQVAQPPFLKTGHLTFGSLNNFAKLNEQVFNTWVTILENTQKTRLIIRNKAMGSKRVRDETCEFFTSRGIAKDRLSFFGSADRPEFLKTYNQIDVSLDTFPYPGGTTTVESLWMGVPVLSRCGDSFLSNVGVSILSNAGLDNWICETEAQYISKAIDMANQFDLLRQLRGKLREQFLKSPICDYRLFAKNFRVAIDQMLKQKTDSRDT